MISIDGYKASLYDVSKKEIWNLFVDQSRNGTFLHTRAYIEYHINRFPDSSLLIFKGAKLVALLPATIKGGALTSHAGLTYGGLLVGRDFHGSDAIETFKAISEWCKASKLNSIYYKAIPHIYHRMPAEEDLYALHILGAKLVCRNLSSTLNMQDHYAQSKGRKATVSKAIKSDLQVSRSYDFERFMRIEADHLLDKHGVMPVHSAEEMKKLAGLFPDSIQLNAAYMNGEMIGGVITYTTDTVCHAQYIGSTLEGKKQGAIDAIIVSILDALDSKIKFFDFGISTIDHGKSLDKNLLLNKESWGARSIVYDQYELTI